MKNIKVKLLLLVSIITIFGVFTSGINMTSAQTITTSCNGGTVTSTINGRLLLNGATTASVWFDWGPTQSLGQTTPRQTFSSDSNFSQALFGLTENTTYYYRAMGQTDSEPVETGDIKSFVTTCTNAQNPTVDIRVDDSSLDSGDSTTVRWNSTNATSCTGSGGRNGWSGSKNLSGSFDTGDLTHDTTYTITCRNSNSSASDDDSVTVRVNDESPNINISASPASVNYNGASTITWNSNNADFCSASSGTNGWPGSKNTSGSFYSGALTNTTIFNINCRNNNGRSANDSVTVTVNNIVPVNNRPTVIISADQTNLAFNGATNIRWSTTNATSCNASNGSIGWAGVKSIGPGSFYTGSLTATRTYSITCSNDVGSATDFVTVGVRGQVLGVTTIRQPASSLVLVTSTVDRNRPIVPTLDNTSPCPGDEINYSLTYQNIGNASISNLVLRVDLPTEVDYMYSTPNNPNRGGQTLIFNLGTLRANGSGTVTVRVRVRDNVPAGAVLNFPATLSYVDPSGFPQSVNANVSANVCGVAVGNTSNVNLGASVFGAGFLPTSIFGWLLLLILILVLILLAKYLFSQSFQKRTVTTFDPPLGGKRTTTTTLQQ